MNEDLLEWEMNEYEVTFVNGEVQEVEAWTPMIAQAIAEEEAGPERTPTVRRQRPVATSTSDRGVATWTTRSNHC